MVVAALALVAAGCGGDDDDEGGGDTGAAADTTGGGGRRSLRQEHLGPPARQRQLPRWETDDRPYFDKAFTDAGVDHTIVNAEGDAARSSRRPSRPSPTVRA